MTRPLTTKRIILRCIDQAIMWSDSFVDANTSNTGEISEDGIEEQRFIEAARKLREKWFGTRRTTVDQIMRDIDSNAVAVDVREVGNGKQKFGKFFIASHPEKPETVTVVGNITSVIADHIFVGYADNGAWAGEYDTEKNTVSFKGETLKAKVVWTADMKPLYEGREPKNYGEFVGAVQALIKKRGQQ